MTQKTPAMMNQYGDTYTGIPNGRATTKPCWPRLSDCSSWLLATSRCYVHPAPARVSGGDRPAFRSKSAVNFQAVRFARCLLRQPQGGVPPETTQNVGGLPYGCAVDIENAVDEQDAGASFAV